MLSAKSRNQNKDKFRKTNALKVQQISHILYVLINSIVSPKLVSLLPYCIQV